MPNDVKWIHITTDMFNDEKIKIIENMPDADSLIVIWVKLICQAGKVNENGWIYLDKEIPYTVEELAMILDRPVSTVKLALELFIRLKMIEWTDQGVYLVNFAKNQNTSGLEKIRENTRRRVAAHRAREKVKLLDSGEHVTLPNVTVTGAEKKRKEYIREEKEDFIKWNNVLNILKSNVTSANYRTWLEGTIGIEINDNEFIVGVKDHFRANYIDNNMRALVEKAVYQECEKNLSLKLVVVGE